MIENKYHRDIILKHKFFKTQKHFFNFVYKIVRDKNIELEFFTKQNIVLLGWCLSKDEILKRNEIDIPINQLTWNMKENKDVSDLVAKLSTVMSELKEVRENKRSIKDCVKCKEVFPFVDENKLFDLVRGKNNFTEEFFETTELLLNTPGVYFLYDANRELIYVGKSYGVGRRVRSSINERSAFYCELLPVKYECEANILEPYYISKLRPVLNSDLVTLDSPSFEINHNYIKTEMYKIFD